MTAIKYNVRSSKARSSGKKRSNRNSGRGGAGQRSWFFEKFALTGPGQFACLIFIAIAMIFGGGPGDLGLSFVLIAATGLLLLIASVRGAGLQAFQSLPLIARLAIGLAVALPFLQMIPLPPAIWHNLPGQALRLDVLQTYGLADAWMPMSVTPAETAYSAVIGLAMLGLFMAVLAMPFDNMRSLIVLMIGVIAIGIFLGILQFSSGGDGFQFHKVAHRGVLAGFFANKNHMGLTLACLVPLSFILAERHVIERPGWVVLLVLGWVATVALLIATNSRAGLLLGLLAMVLASVRVFRRRYKQVLAGVAVIGVATVALATYVPAIQDIVDRFGRTGQDVRINILEQAMPLVQQYGLLGSGLGSFASVYAPTEQLLWVNPFYVNHLHNDWLQLIIEAGVPGVVVLVLFAASLFLAFRAVWAAPAPKRSSALTRLPNERSIAWAGMVIILLFAAHSIGDYPVRRVGTLVLLVVALAWVFRSLRQPGFTSQKARQAADG